ncbi:MAG: hypothetical protein CL678_03925 [Bdellovibrionaceae bacterium]|nr:hypothetical protein [Pseudobdellovibrionaceae bacterium]|tara:strand:+ start:29 stop:1270 length:1242 start_codon:yes stop_codon:yes gene_type:complete
MDLKTHQRERATLLKRSFGLFFNLETLFVVLMISTSHLGFAELTPKQRDQWVSDESFIQTVSESNGNEVISYDYPYPIDQEHSGQVLKAVEAFTAQQIEQDPNLQLYIMHAAHPEDWELESSERLRSKHQAQVSFASEEVSLKEKRKRLKKLILWRVSVSTGTSLLLLTWNQWDMSLSSPAFRTPLIAGMMTMILTMWNAPISLRWVEVKGWLPRFQRWKKKYKKAHQQSSVTESLLKQWLVLSAYNTIYSYSITPLQKMNFSEWFSSPVLLEALGMGAMTAAMGVGSRGLIIRLASEKANRLIHEFPSQRHYFEARFDLLVTILATYVSVVTTLENLGHSEMRVAVVGLGSLGVIQYAYAKWPRVRALALWLMPFLPSWIKKFQEFQFRAEDEIRSTVETCRVLFRKVVTGY